MVKPPENRALRAGKSAGKSVAPPLYAARMSLFYGGYFGLNGIYLPLFPIWLAERGLGPAEIAICLAAPLFGRVALTAPASIFADRAPNRRFAIRIFLFIAVFAFAFADVVAGFWAILAVTGIATLFWNLALPPGEALALTGVRRFGLDYGRMRLFGSAGFVVANLGGGLLIAWLSDGIVFWLLVASFAMAFLVSITLPVTPPEERALDDAERPKPVSEPRSLRATLLNPVLLVLIIAPCLLQGSHGALYGFASLHWQSAGYSSATIGALWATGVVAEIVLFTFSGRIGRRIGSYGLIIIAAVAAVVRWSCFSLDPSLPVFFLLQAMHSLSFGAGYAGMQRAIAERVHEEATVSAQGMAGTLSSLLQAACTLAAGPLYRAFGVHGFLAMVVPAGLALVMLLSILPVIRRERRLGLSSRGFR